VRAPVGVGIGLLLLAALLPSAHAQPRQDLLAGSQWPWSAPQQPHPAVARVTVPQRQNMMAFGSGTLVDANDKLGLVITNWHVVEGAAGEITVAFPDGFRSGARVLKVDRDWDLAALAIWKPPVKPVALSSQPPRPGDTLTIAGYGQGRYRAASGRCTQYVAPGVNYPYEMIEVAAAARQGDSGGPIFNSSGQLAGVLFGEGGGRTSGSYCGRVHQFLSTIAIPPGGLSAVATAGLAPAASPASVPPADRPVAAIPPQEAWSSQDALSSQDAWSPAAQTTVPVREPPAPAPLLPPPTAMQPIGLTRDSSAWSAASPSNRFQAAPQPAAAVAAEGDSTWSDWIGGEPLEQIKAALAVVGAMSLVLHGLRWLRGG
jgi:S1-C subfamily serine protease